MSGSHPRRLTPGQINRGTVNARPYAVPCGVTGEQLSTASPEAVATAREIRAARAVLYSGPAVVLRRGKGDKLVTVGGSSPSRLRDAVQTAEGEHAAAKRALRAADDRVVATIGTQFALQARADLATERRNVRERAEVLRRARLAQQAAKDAESFPRTRGLGADSGPSMRLHVER